MKEKNNPSRDDKIAGAILKLNSAQFSWIKELRAKTKETLTEDELKILFVKARLDGLRHTVSLLLVRAQNKLLGHPVGDRRICSIAYGAYRCDTANAVNNEKPKTRPTPSLRKGAVIPKASIPASGR